MGRAPEFYEPALACNGCHILRLNLLERLSDGPDGLIELLPGDHQRRLYAYYVAVDTTDADEDSGGEAEVANRFRLGSAGRALVVGHQFYPHHQSEPTDFSNHR